MKLYLDVSRLNRPLDDQSHVRIRLETEAISMILERFDLGVWTQVASGMSVLEIEAMPHEARRARVRLLLPDQSDILDLDDTIYDAAALQRLGLKAADAVHVAAAERLSADAFLTCDDRLVQVARRHRRKLAVRVANPLDWLPEVGDGPES